MLVVVVVSVASVLRVEGRQANGKKQRSTKVRGGHGNRSTCGQRERTWSLMASPEADADAARLGHVRSRMCVAIDEIGWGVRLRLPARGPVWAHLNSRKPYALPIIISHHHTTCGTLCAGRPTKSCALSLKCESRRLNIHADRRHRDRCRSRHLERRDWVPRERCRGGDCVLRRRSHVDRHVCFARLEDNGLGEVPRRSS